jgi:NAD-dependent SIR2 family protein deacetylase
MNMVCQKCNVPLESGPVTVQYMENAFPVELPRCPQCGLVFVPEPLATGKMLEVEKALEDK